MKEDFEEIISYIEFENGFKVLVLCLEVFRYLKIFYLRMLIRIMSYIN